MRLLVCVALVAAFSHNAHVTWERWGDLIIDTGRELDTPKQLAEGKVLYRDVRYWYGPLAPYWHALLYRMFGVRIDVLTTMGLGLAALLGWVSYRILRLFAGRWVSAAGAGGVLYVHAFGFYRYPNIFNFVLPYSYPAAYGVLLAMGSIFFLIRYSRRARARDLFFSCGLLGLTGLCKLEPLFAALAAHGALAAIRIWRGEADWRRFAIGYGGAATVVVLVFGGFRVVAGPGLWHENLFIPGNVNANQFLLKHSGFDSPFIAARRVAMSLMGLGGCLGLGAIGAIAERRVIGRGSIIAIGVGLGIAAIVVVWMFDAADVLAGTPLILLAAAVASGIAILRRRSNGGDGFAVLIVFAMAAMLRMGLDCSAEHYGFYLMAPGFLALVVVACAVWPASLRRVTGKPAVTAQLCGVALIIGLATLHVRKRAFAMSILYPQAEQQLVRGPRGEMIIAANYLGAGDRAVSFLSSRPRGTKVVVLPEGSAMTFLSGCDNPMGVHTYLPPDFSGTYDESGIVARVSAASPEYFLFDSRAVTEYGKVAFGEDYAGALEAWVGERYQVIETFTGRSFGVRVLGRR